MYIICIFPWCIKWMMLENFCPKYSTENILWNLKLFVSDYYKWGDMFRLAVFLKPWALCCRVMPCPIAGDVLSTLMLSRCCEGYLLLWVLESSVLTASPARWGKSLKKKKKPWKMCLSLVCFPRGWSPWTCLSTAMERWPSTRRSLRLWELPWKSRQKVGMWREPDGSPAKLLDSTNEAQNIRHFHCLQLIGVFILTSF